VTNRHIAIARALVVVIWKLLVRDRDFTHVTET
jgi:hypothetical protein